MDPVYKEITGASASRTSTSRLSADALAGYIAENIGAGHAVSAGSYYGALQPIVTGHAYTVKSIEYTGGQWSVTVHNGWE